MQRGPEGITRAKAEAPRSQVRGQGKKQEGESAVSEPSGFAKLHLRMLDTSPPTGGWDARPLT